VLLLIFLFVYGEHQTTLRFSRVVNNYYLRGMANDRFMGVRGHREEYIQGVSGAMTGLGTSLPPGIEICEQAVVAAGAVVRDS
jgi:hypothetical protein